jgi:hypothetical protein
MPHQVIHHLLRSGSENAVDGGAADRRQRVGWEEDDQQCSFMDHVGRLDRRQRSRHASSCSLVDHVPREARVLLRRAPRFLAQARSGQQELTRERGWARHSYEAAGRRPWHGGRSSPKGQCRVRLRRDRPRNDRWLPLLGQAKPLGKSLLEHALEPVGQVVLRLCVRNLDGRRLPSRRHEYECSGLRRRLARLLRSAPVDTSRFAGGPPLGARELGPHKRLQQPRHIAQWHRGGGA